MAVSFPSGVTSLDRPGGRNSSAALWSNDKTHDAVADQAGAAAVVLELLA
jgi:hypothetical protein